ncbi:hypothetical protein PABG_11673 [Paracoccidioides brasiliensis Pb03]|nr:hypothetical protein PABG_11673 [Paracoccidioides brasiliensis Pb03]
MSNLHSFLSYRHLRPSKAKRHSPDTNATFVETPAFLMGHSGGGAECLYYVLNSTRPWNTSQFFLGRLERRKDTLCPDMGTLDGLGGMLDRGLWLESEQVEESDKLKKDQYGAGHGSADEVDCYEASRCFVERLKLDEKTF